MSRKHTPEILKRNQRIFNWREKGYTQEMIAEKFGLSRPAINVILNKPKVSLRKPYTKIRKRAA